MRQKRNPFVVPTFLGLSGGLAMIAWRRLGSSSVPEWYRNMSPSRALLSLGVSLSFVIVGAWLIKSANRD